MYTLPFIILIVSCSLKLFMQTLLNDFGSIRTLQ